MVAIAAFPHDDVHHATQRAAVLRFVAGGLDLDFLNEVEGNVGVGIAADEVSRVLTFHQIGILGVRSTADGVAERLPVGALPGIVPPPPLAVVVPIRGSLRADGANWMTDWNERPCGTSASTSPVILV